jgi:AcrR family transcriptional regulator
MGAGREQIAAGCPQALSINAIARQLGTSGPAIYRYFPSRDDLLVAAVAWAYDDLAAALGAAAHVARRQRPAARFRAVAEAYRKWALEHPQFYRLVFANPAGSGETAPDVIVPASHRGMLILIDVLREHPRRRRRYRLRWKIRSRVGPDHERAPSQQQPISPMRYAPGPACTEP